MIRLMKYVKKLWWMIALIVILLVVQAWMQLLLPDYMANILTVLQDTTITDASERMSLIWKNGGIMIGLTFGILMCAIAIGIMNSITGAVYGRNIREAMYKRIMSFSLNEFDRFGTASLLTRTTNDINTLKDTYMMVQRTAIFSPVMLGVAITKALMLDWKISLVFAFSIPILVIAIVITFAKASPLFTQIQKKIDNITVVLRENLTGVRVIRAFNQQEREFDRFTEKNQEMTDTIIKVGRTMSYINPVINIVFNLTYIGVYFVGFALLDGQALGPSSATTFVNVITISNYSSNIMMSFLMLGMIAIQIPRANACSKRIRAVLDTPYTVSDPETPVDPSSIPEENRRKVEFKHVTFAFPGSSEPTLKDISFTAESGKTTAIIGSTGSGKSSIINLIPRFYDATEGEVLVDGVDVRSFSQHDLRAKIGFVPQQARLFSGTIKDNLLYGNPNASDDDLEQALGVAQASHFVGKKEDGINSIVAQGGKNFSGGQKQRLAIARALVKRPEIYVFDDSFSALDFRTDIKLRTALKWYVEDSSVIVVAQRVSSILDADKILVLNEGCIVGEGTHNELLKTCKVYQQIVMSQLDKDEIEKTMKMQEEVLANVIHEGGGE